MGKQSCDLASPGDIREAIVSLDLMPDTETVTLDDVRGRVLTGRIDAELDIPGFNRANMDGYVVCARDTFGADEADPVGPDLAGAVHAGNEPDAAIDLGTAAKISTSVVMPPGADAVVIVERIEGRNDSLVVYSPVAPGNSVMPARTDAAVDTCALGPRIRLASRGTGLLLTLDIDEVPIRRKPIIGIISAGDELVRSGGELHPEAGGIYGVNSYIIVAGVKEVGDVPKLYPRADNGYEETEYLLRRAVDEYDPVLLSGSTPASAVDVIYRVVEERDELLLHGVSVEPGKPMFVGTLGEGSTYISLPGYPVPALTIFRTFTAPTVRDAAGFPEPRTVTVKGTMTAHERYAEGRMRLTPVGLATDGDGETLVYPVDKGPGTTAGLVEADSVVEVLADVGYLAEGESTTVHLLPPDVRAPALFGVGEDDPAFSRVLDHVSSPRYLLFGPHEDLRWLRGGISDVAAVASDRGDAIDDIDTVGLGSWTRERGLVIPAGDPDGVFNLADLVDNDLRFINRDSNSGLRVDFGNVVATLAGEHETIRHELVESIEGFDRGTRAFESPAQAVAAGRADAGLNLHATADSLGLDFVSFETQPVTVLANPARIEKPGVDSFRDAFAASDDASAGLSGFEGGQTPR